MPAAPLTLARPQITAWRNALFVTFGLAGLALSTWLSRVPAIRDQLDVSTSVIGIVLFGIAAGSIVGLTASSHVIARVGATKVVLFGLGIGTLGLPIAALGASLGSVQLTAAGLVVFGAGNGMCDVALNVSGAANERAVKRAIMPIYHAMFSVGTVVGTGVGAAAEALGIPVLLHCTVMTVVILVVLVTAVRWFQSELVGVAPAPAGQGSAPEGWRQRLSAWGEGRTLLIGAIALGMAFAEGSANDWLALAMVDGHGLANEQAALMLALFLVSMTAGRFAGVALLDRFGRVPVLRASAVSAVLGLGLIIFVPDPAIAVLGTILWGLGASLGFPVGMSAAADDPRKAAGRVSAVATIGYLAFLAGPPLIGFLGDHIGLLNGLIPVLVLVALSGLASSAAREPKETAAG